MTDPDELTADEARDLADELGLDLYRAQDALAFVGECCDIADRAQRPITTADVREWLKGARCTRQIAADTSGPARGILASVLAAFPNAGPDGPAIRSRPLPAELVHRWRQTVGVGGPRVCSCHQQAATEATEPDDEDEDEATGPLVPPALMDAIDRANEEHEATARTLATLDIDPSTPDGVATTPVRTIAHHVPAEAYRTWTEQAPAASCRIMETRTCPPSYNGPCGDRPCARFESDDPGPWLDQAEEPDTGAVKTSRPFPYPSDVAEDEAPLRAQLHAAADDDQKLRWARRESLLVLLTRLQRGRHLTEDEARTLRHHVETEMREADTARTEVTRLGLMVDEYGKGASTLSEKLQKARRAADLLADSHQRAEQLEELLSVAHETSNRSEAERALAAQRAEIAETELRVLRAGLRANGADPTQIQNLWAQISLRNRQWREAKQERAQAQAAIERVRAAIADRPPLLVDGRPASDYEGGWRDAFRAVLAALDGTEQPTTEAGEDDALRAKLDEATATLRRIRAVTKDWEHQVLPRSEAHRLLVEVRDALAGPRPDHDAEQPREHCGTLSPDTGFTTPRTECTLRPGHSGSHADDVGCRWWYDPTLTEEETMPTCTATIEGPHLPDAGPVRCNREASHPGQHAGDLPEQGEARWTDHHAGATPHEEGKDA